MSRKLRMGMIGGGLDAFIGAVHRMAAALDGQIELVCGAFSSKPEKSKQAGASLLLNPARVYESFSEMIKKEKARARSRHFPVPAQAHLPLEALGPSVRYYKRKARYAPAADGRPRLP